MAFIPRSFGVFRRSGRRALLWLALLLATACAHPAFLDARGHDRRVDLRWDPSPATVTRGYAIYRATSEHGPFERINPALHPVHVYSDFVGANDRTWFYRVARIDNNDVESEPSLAVSATPRAASDEQLLTSIQEAAFRYFWDFGHPVSGLAREGYTHPREVCTTGGTGFGVMTILVGVERGFVARSDAARRLLRIAAFLEDRAHRYHGAWSHWLDGATGATIPFAGKVDDGGDLVETSFLIQGLLTARQYFDRDEPVENELRQRITRMWHGVEWDWYLRDAGSRTLYWHWSPLHEWQLDHRIVGFNECLITYVLAMASPTHPIPLDCYEQGWIGDPARYGNGATYHGIEKPVGEGVGGPLFFTHYSFLGLDPSAFTDRFCNYFDNNRRTTLINRAYCIANPGRHRGYGPLLWGLTASQNPDGYRAHAPAPELDDGTIAPTAMVCALPYTPTESMAAIRHLYREYGARIWGPFGFHDAFNLDRDWVSPSYLAIDQGPMAPMIENHRTRLCWRLFLANPEVADLLERLSASERRRLPKFRLEMR